MQAAELKREAGSEALTPPEQDYYAVNLAEVNENNEVVSTEDIVNARGVLICRKGMRITHDVAHRIVQHKLVKPLEDQVQITKSVSNELLHGQCKALLEKLPDLRQTHTANKFEADFGGLFVGRTLHPALIQKLTVMAERSPHDLEKALFCAWLTGLIARELGLDHATTHAGFIAALLHDVGFLHIDPEILAKKEQLSLPEWRAVQSHVVIGKLVLENVPEMNPQAARAVIEHHERCDGSGYPLGKNDEHLSLLGQIVGITDSIQSIRVHQFQPKGRNLRDLLPYLQMNATTHFYDVYKALTAILKASGLKPTLVKPSVEIATFAGQLLDRGRGLQETAEILIDPKVFELLGDGKGNGHSVSMYKIAHHVQVMSLQSGLLSAELCDWLAQVKAHPDEGSLPELNEIELMQRELLWQLRHAARSFESCMESAADQGRADFAALQPIMGKMKASLEKLA